MSKTNKKLAIMTFGIVLGISIIVITINKYQQSHHKAYEDLNIFEL